MNTFDRDPLLPDLQQADDFGFGVGSALRLPGDREPERRVHAVLIEVELDGFGIHTARQFGGRLETHPFFSRQALHSATWDLWAPVPLKRPEPIVLPYGGTPLWADEPERIEMIYGSPSGFRHRSNRSERSLSLGVMEAMPPGTRLRAMVWGEEASLPPFVEGEGFWIGKGRAPATIVRVEHEDAVIRADRLGWDTLPIEVPIAAYETAVAEVPHTVVATTPYYLVVKVAPSYRMPCVRVAGVSAPALEFAV